MVKSRAEIQREYRKRLKEDAVKYENYLSQARLRKQKNYTPAASLPKREKVRRNEKNREYLQRHRQKRKVERELENAQIDVQGTSGYETDGQSSERIPLLVNLSFPNRRNGPRKRISRALSKKSKELKQMKSNFESLRMKYRKTLRNLQRIKKKTREQSRKTEEGNKSADKHFELESHKQLDTNTEETTAIPDKNQMLTPKSRTKELMTEANLSRKQQATVKKQLLFGFVLQSQLNKKKRGMKPTQIGSLRGMIGGDILNKYHLKKFANKEIGLGRNRMNNYRNGKVGRNREVEKHKEKVIEFLERDDNSRANPGKRDKIKDKGVTNQTRTLVDYLKNLHQKFISENPGAKLSLTSFCRIRPAHKRPTAFISRSSCLCTRHQNMALCVRASKKYGMNIPLNPEYFINDEDAKKALENDIPETVKFGQWKRVAVDEKGKKKMVMKIVEKEMKRDDFLEFMKLQIDDFKAHVSRIKRQYSEIGALKSNLKRGEIIMHMDFAENYACKTVEEVQSAYWTQTGVTLHPIVVYYIDSEDKLSHQSFVVVSDEMGHNSSTVLAFLDMVHPEVRKLVPDLKRVHYWTDSPTSQYRNKTIFSTVARHKDLYNTEATWNYFECGHGKGPCDGLGGITKRMADEAVRSGKVIIQDGQDFFAWTQSNTCTMQRVKFVFVSSDECQKKAEELGKVSVKPIKGTMKIHAVVGTANGSILTADVSCCCGACRGGTFCVNHWKEETMNISTHSAEQNEILMETDQNTIDKQYKVGEYVAAIYMNQWYIGKVNDISVDDGEVEIQFLTFNKKYQSYQWPIIEDKIWINSTDILMKIDEPIPTGRSKRAYKVSDDDLESIRVCFVEFSQHIGQI